VIVHSTGLGRLPPVEAADPAGEESSREGLLATVRARPWLAVAVAGGALLMIAWIAWAVHVTTDKGVREGIGVLVAWPALVAAAALIVLPFVGVLLLARQSSEPDAEDLPKTDEKDAELTEPG
jgi:hypothetical protein